MISRNGGYMLCKKVSSQHTQTERARSILHWTSWMCVGNFHWRLSSLKECLSLRYGRLTTCNTYTWMILGLSTVQAHHTSSNTCQDRNWLLEHYLPRLTWCQCTSIKTSSTMLDKQAMPSLLELSQIFLGKEFTRWELLLNKERRRNITS